MTNGRIFEAPRCALLAGTLLLASCASSSSEPPGGFGGDTDSGGMAASGGSSGSGGATGSGGDTTGAGGSVSTDGTGGATGSGGSASGGVTGSGGAGTGGAAGSGGVVGTGGKVGGGGTSGGGGSPGTCPSISDFATWPSGQSPSDIGPLAVSSFKSHTGDAYGYAWAFTYFGALQLTKLTGDSTNNSYLIGKFDCGQQGPDNSSTATVDSRAFGDLPLEIYLENQDARCKALGLLRADSQWTRMNSDGITADARYWADDMFMITGLQMFAYRATKDSKYLDRAAKAMQVYFTKLQQPNGLFWHTTKSHAHWGRANGWVAVGMTELLLDLPPGATRDAIMLGYKHQMDGLLPLQIASGADAGFWRQVLDLATTASYAESSCTAMFTYALVNGIKNGWLTDPKYVTAARNGWLALGNNAKGTGQLGKVCPGTGEAPGTDITSQQKFYTDRPPGSNDMHGQASLLWAAKSLLRTDCPGVR